VVKQAVLVILLVCALRLPFLGEAVQGDDVYYLYGGQHALVDPLHPLHTEYAFEGRRVDMRGHPHGPLNSSVLGLLMRAFGGVRERPFHVAYMGFSLIAAVSMLVLARRFVPDHALSATLLFVAVPAFVVNGNSLESDLVFLAFWMLAIATWMHAVAEKSLLWLAISVLAAALAALDAYQAGLLFPLLWLNLWLGRERWQVAWIATCAAPATIVLWQAWEWWSSGVLPMGVLLGYMQSGALQSATNKVASTGALTAHLGWLVFPPLVWLALVKSTVRWQWAVVAIAAMAGAVRDPHPMFWMSLATGVLLLVHTLVQTLRRDYLAGWVLLFFGASVLIFFAGSARYLLPLAAPVAMWMARSVERRYLRIGVVAQFVVSLGLAGANHQHWAAEKAFADGVLLQANGRRVWVNAELGIRHYLEEGGARPLLRDSVVGGDDLIVTSDLVRPVAPIPNTIQWLRADVRPSIPFRILSIEGGAGYSTASKGLRPFEVSDELVDHLTADIVFKRKPEVSYIDPKGAGAAAHVVSGLYADGWMSKEASLVVKGLATATKVHASLYLPPGAPAKNVALLVDGRIVAERMLGEPGLVEIEVPFESDTADVRVGLRVDATYNVPGDGRDLGLVVTGIGLR
jgi:hypothetical protein